MRLALIALLLSGCTINVVDKRITREEVAAALNERDVAIGKIAAVIKQMQDKAKDGAK